MVTGHILTQLTHHITHQREGTQDTRMLCEYDDIMADSHKRTKARRSYSGYS